MRFVKVILLAAIATALCAEAADAQLLKRFRRAKPAQCEGDDCPKAVQPKTFIWPFVDDEPAQEPAVPHGIVARNEFVASKLGGYNRANHTTKGGHEVDVYQCRGKQRVVWAVGIYDQWQSAFIEALANKSRTGAHQAAVALIGDGVPVDCVAACEASGTWLLLVSSETGEAIKVIYPQPVPSPDPVDETADEWVDPLPDVEPVPTDDAEDNGDEIADESADEPAEEVVVDEELVTPLPAPDVEEELPLPDETPVDETADAEPADELVPDSVAPVDEETTADESGW